MTAGESSGRRDDAFHDEWALAAYLEGELDESAAMAWDEHLLLCDSCWEAMEEEGRGRALAESLRDAPPADLRARIELAVGAAAPSRRPPPPRRRRAITAAVVAAAVVIAAVGGLFAAGRRDHGPDDPDPIAVVLDLAADSDAAMPTRTEDGLVFSRLRVEGRDVVLARWDRPFPMPEGAVALADDPHSLWLARRDGLSLLCFSSPSPVLLAGRASPESLTDVAAALGLIAERNQRSVGGVS